MHLNRISLPVIDLPKINKSTLLTAITEYGAFYVTNHNIKNISSLFSSARSFFNQPLESKQSINSVKSSSGFMRGYVGIGKESGSHFFERKEAFSLGYNFESTDSPKNCLQGHNVWSSKTSDQSKAIMNGFYNDMADCADRITSELSLLLSNNDSLSKLSNEGRKISLLRLFHYHPYLNSNEIGSSEHTDWGMLTLIAQTSHGLQIYKSTDCTGEWYDVNPCDDAILVNAGDYLSLITNGRVHSPVHRVVNYPTDKCNSKENRISAVFFFYPNFDATFPTLSTEKNMDTSDLSVMKNQNDRKESIEMQVESFGEYIGNKWAQVSR